MFPRSVLLLATVAIVLPNAALAAPAATIGYTGVLVGDAQSEWWHQSLGDQTFTFRLCASEAGTCTAPCISPPNTGCLWQQALAGVSVEGGHFSVELGGEAAPFPSTAFAGDVGLWLEVEHAGTPLGPRVKLSRVPFAAWADTAATCDRALALDAVAAGAFAQATHNHDDRYLTDAETDTAIDGKVSAATGPIQTAIDGKANSDDVYSKAQANQTFALLTALSTAISRLDDAEGRLDAHADTIDAQAAAIVALQEALQAEHTCPKEENMAAVGDVCVDMYHASVWSRKDGQPVDCAALQAAVDAALAAGWTDAQVYQGDNGACSANPPLMCAYREYGSPAGCHSDNACDDYPPEWPDSGNWTKPLYACAVKSVYPSRSLTWFQAQQACGSSGRHLITNGEWQMAVAGTPDPGSNSGADGSCNTSSTGTTRRTGNAADKCVSKWGVEDMIGNLWQWADLWGQAGNASSSYSNGASVAPWPAGYSSTDEDGGTIGSQTKDGTYNVNGVSYSNGTGGWTSGLPFAVLRGGDWSNGGGIASGAFAFNSIQAPSHWGWNIGFRCAKGL